MYKSTLRLGISVTLVMALLIYIALFIKLVTLGATPYSHDLGPTFLPVGHIDNSVHSFSVATGPGSLVIPVFAGLLAAAGRALYRKGKA